MIFIAWRVLHGLQPSYLESTAAYCVNLAHKVAVRFDRVDMLLPDTHPDVVQYMNKCKAQPISSQRTIRTSTASSSSRNKSDQKQKKKWAVRHTLSTDVRKV